MKQFLRLTLLTFIFLLTNAMAWAQGNSQNGATPIGQWQFTASWYFGLLPDYEVIQPIKLMNVQGHDVTAECLDKVTFSTSEANSIAVQRVPEGHSSGMTGYWLLKAGQTSGNASITGTYNGPSQWGQSASTTFTVFCGDPYNSSWLQNNMFGIDPLLVYAAAGSTVSMPTITVNGSRNVLTDFDIIAVRSSNSDNVTVIGPAYNNTGVLLHGYQFEVKNTTATRIWIEVKGKGNFEGYWAKIYFNINGMTKRTEGMTGDDVTVVPWDGSDPGSGGGETPAPVTPTASYSVKIPVPNYVLASGQTIHQTPSVIKTEKANDGTLTDTNVSDYYIFSYTCDRPDYAYVADDGTVTALKEIKEPVYINVKATPTEAGVTAGCKETSTSYSVQIYTSESVIRLNPTALTIPMKSATEGEQRLVPSIIMKVNGMVYEPNQENTYDLSYEGFDPSIVTLVDKYEKVLGEDGFSMPDVMYFKALKAGTTQGIAHAKGKGINSGFWGTAPFTITVTPYVPSSSETPTTGAIREISIPVPFYTMAYGNTIRQRIMVKEYADAEAKKNDTYTDVTSQYTFSHTSSNTQIATVDDTGLVTAVADNVNPAYIKVTATPIGTAPAVSPASFGVKVFGGASVISLSSKNIRLAPNELVPLPEVFVTVNGVKYSSENAFNMHYEVTDHTKAVVVNNEKLRGVDNGNTTLQITAIGKGEYEGFYCTAVVDVNVRVSETLDGTDTWYWAQAGDGARSAIYNLYPGKQLHFEFINKTADTGKDDAGWTFVASKTPGYSDQAFLAASPFANLMTWDGWGENANPQPVVKVNNADHALTSDEMTQFKSDLQNAKVDYIVALNADGRTLSINAVIEAKDENDVTVRTYTYTIANKQLSYEVGVLPVYFSSVRSTIETLRLVPQQYNVTVMANDGGTVKVIVNGEEAQNLSRSFEHIIEGIEESSHVVIMAVPDGSTQAGGTEGRYYFVKWTEDNSTNITRDFYIDHNISLTANFRADEKKWLDVTTDGQDYLLNKNNYDNDYFFKIKNGETIVAETTWSKIDLFNQYLTPLYGTDNHHIELYVRGAKAFKVYAYDENGVESEYIVKVDNGEATTVSHHGTALETSQLFSISDPIAVNAEGTGYNTITIAANDNQLYPFLVQFFTKDIITQTANRQYVTTADGVADEAIVASALATGGTLSSVTYSNNSDKEIATVEVSNDGKLIITGHKAGNILVKLNFTGGANYSDASFDYSIIVKKRDLRLSWSKKSINLHYNAAPEEQHESAEAQFNAPQSRAAGDYSQFATLSLKEYTPDGDTIEIAVDDPLRQKISFASTDASLIDFSGNTPTFGKKDGTADLTARISEDDQFLENSASVCINITPMGGIYYEIKTDDKPAEGDGLHKELNGTGVVARFDMHVYKYNNKLAEVPADGKVERTTKDIWGDVKEYQGSDAMKKVWYIDGFSNNAQGNQNAMNEHFRILEQDEEDKNEYRIKFVGENTYTTVEPFSLPVRGSFVKFEALQNGMLICYSLQNGNLNFNHISEYESKKNSPLASNPRLYYWFDQEGKNLQDVVTATTKQPLAVGRRDDLPELTKSLTDWITKDTENKIGAWYAAFPSQWDVDRNQEKDNPNPQSILKYKGGYSIMNKAYVKYEVPVRMGNTYYFFSNDSKVAFAGVKFVPADNQPTETLALSESDDWSDEAHQALLGESFATATLTRSFIKNQWNTICLPFNVSEKQVEEVFGVGTQLLIYDGIKNINGQNIAQFLRHVDQNILAGQPYFIYSTGVDKDGNDLATVSDGKIQSLTFHNITVPADLHVRSYGNDDEDGLRMVGALSKTPVAKYDYYVNTNTGAITRYTGNGTTLNTYRAFLQQTHPLQARTMTFGYTDIEAEAMGTPTGLFEVICELGVGKKKVQDGVYNINGQKVSITTENLNHGVYIIDGKKYTK